MSSLMLLSGNNTAARHQGAIDLLLLKFWGPGYSLPSLSLAQTAAWMEGSFPKDFILTDLESPFCVSSSVSFVGLSLCTLAICFHAPNQWEPSQRKSSSKHRTKLRRETWNAKEKSFEFASTWLQASTTNYLWTFNLALPETSRFN